MIGRLSGILIEKQPSEILVDVAGVGYEVHVPLTTYFSLPAVKEPVVLLTHLSISENAHTLYGFASKKGRDLFRVLIKVSGVGPKMAAGILSGMEPDELVGRVMANDINALTKVPGVGKKTAERLVIETRDRLKDWLAVGDPLAQMVAASEGLPANEPDISQEAESALVALGYKPAQAARMIAQASKGQVMTSSEDLIRLALKSAV